MARGIERHFDEFNWMIFGEYSDGVHVDVVTYGPANHEVFVHMNKQLAENVIAMHNQHLESLKNQLIEYGYGS